MIQLHAARLVVVGLMTINLVVSGLLWYRHRTPLYRSAFLLWVFTLATLVAQVLANSSPALVFAFASTGYCLNACLADLLRQALDLRLRWRLHLALFALGVGMTSALVIAEAPFWAFALPVAVAMVTPLVEVTARVLRAGWRRHSIPARCALFAVMLCGLHTLDYPFLGDDSTAAPFGIATGILLIFSLSVTIPLIIQERMGDRVRQLQAEMIERARLAAIGEAAAVVAHEVRNPLGCISNAVQLLRQEPALSGQGREVLDTQQMEIARLDRLAQDLLIFTKPLQPRVGQLDLAALLKAAALMLARRADAARVQIELRGCDTPQPVSGDGDHLLIALTNLLQNAIEASPPGTTVRARVAQAWNGPAVEIEDEGNGIGPEALEHLFKPFFTTRANGSGLGLAIVERIMRAHGGAVSVENRAQGGACFRLRFSAEPLRAEAIESKAGLEL